MDHAEASDSKGNRAEGPDGEREKGERNRGAGMVIWTMPCSSLCRPVRLTCWIPRSLHIRTDRPLHIPCMCAATAKLESMYTLALLSWLTSAHFHTNSLTQLPVCLCAGVQRAASHEQDFLANLDQLVELSSQRTGTAGALACVGRQGASGLGEGGRLCGLVHVCVCVSCSERGAGLYRHGKCEGAL